ncbi:MAG: hypothetical protein JWP69_1064 [Flaviaesturariibacter sp.]|nr:hypothetical protein [Flaviaesturariibacter sp.]
MKTLFTAIALLSLIPAFSQLEISTGVAVNKNDAMGMPVHAGYEFQISNRLYTKSQVGYKRLRHYNDYVGATLRVSIGEIHQTFSYQVVKRKRYIFQPNLGLNYRFYKWEGEMDQPYNALPQRAWVIGTREKNFVLNSYDNGYSNVYKVSNLGFSLQLQSQFKLSDKLWLHLTPFMEPDYDRSQNTGGCYIGVIFKSL